MNLDDKDIGDLAAILRRLLDETKYPYSREARCWRELLQKLAPEPTREPLPPLPKIYAPPSKGRYRRRG
jgi:hypothetical protein